MRKIFPWLATEAQTICVSRPSIYLSIFLYVLTPEGDIRRVPVNQVLGLVLVFFFFFLFFVFVVVVVVVVVVLCNVSCVSSK